MLRRLEPSYKTVIFSVLFLLSLWFIYQIKDIIFMVFVAVILMSALNPAVDKLEKHRLPRSLAIALLYLVLWIVLGTLIAFIVPGVVSQTTRLIQVVSTGFSHIDFLTAHQQDISQQLISYLGSLPSDLLQLLVNFFNNVITVLTTIVISFYLTLEHKNLDFYLAKLINPQKSEPILTTLEMIEQRLGSWVRGELVLMTSIGIFTYLGLTVLGVDIALPLAILAGLMEIIPNIGPIISALPAVLIAWTIHPLLALSTVALYFLIHFLENNFLVPKIMQKAVGVHPLISILALLIGFRILGPLGAVLGIPLVIILQVVLQQKHLIPE